MLGVDPNVNTQAEILENVRNDALQDAINVVNAYALRCQNNEWINGSNAANDIVGYIRALKSSKETE